MTPQTPNMSWDDLLDDYEDRIDAIWSALEDGGELNTPMFVYPAGVVGTPTAKQQQRFADLQTDAADAEVELGNRLEVNRSEHSSLQLRSKARRTYVGAQRLGR